MDIFLSKSFDFGNGGALAAPWSDCSVNTNDGQVEAFQKKVRPIVEAQWNAHQSRVTFAQARPYPMPMGHVVIGADAEYPITTITVSDVAKTKRKKSEFQKALKERKILLSPMRAVKVRASATPRLIGGTQPTKIYVSRDYVEHKICEKGAGHCRPSWRPSMSAEADVFGHSYRGVYDYIRNVTTVAVPQYVLSEIVEEVLSKLDGVAPNGGLVTTVVAEANSATFDLSTELAEMPETIKMIVAGIKTGINLLVKARREMMKSLSSGSLPKDVAAIWMTYRYGIMPIMYTIEDAVSLLEAESRVFQSFRGRQDDTLEIEVSGYKGKIGYQQRVFLKQRYALESSWIQGIKFDPLATAWELVPLSFVFDWFFQVGDYLTALGTPSAVGERAATDSIRCKTNAILESTDGSQINLELDYYRVTAINPPEHVALNSDVFMSFKRSMDAIALSWLLFKKDKRQ